MPHPKDFHQKIDMRNVNAHRAGLVPFRTTIMLRPNKQTVFPDVINRPTLLVTRDVRDIIRKYDEHVAYRQIAYLDSENEKTQLYFMPMLESIDCLSEASEYENEYNASFSKVAIKKEAVRDKSLFLIKTEVQRVVIIRLDLAESLLVRKYKGFSLTEAIIET